MQVCYCQTKSCDEIKEFYLNMKVESMKIRLKGRKRKQIMRQCKMGAHRHMESLLCLGSVVDPEMVCGLERVNK